MHVRMEYKMRNMIIEIYWKGLTSELFKKYWIVTCYGISVVLNGKAFKSNSVWESIQIEDHIR